MRGALAICVLAVSLLLVVPDVASAGTACWKRLLVDWSDGRIDGLYPVSCYRQALAHMPADLQDYSSAPGDIRAALQRRLHDPSAATRSLAASSMAEARGSSSAWTKALPVVGVAGAGSLALAGALGLAVRGTRKRRSG